MLNVMPLFEEHLQFESCLLDLIRLFETNNWDRTSDIRHVWRLLKALPTEWEGQH